MQFETSTTIAAAADTIFALYADVPNWPSWDPDAKAASIEGAFVSGAKGVITPNGGPKSTIYFTEVIRNRSFTVDCNLPLCLMRFEHELEAAGDGTGGTRATHRVIFSGALAFFFGRVIGSGMKKSLPQALAGLKVAAEKASQSPSLRRVA
jgi:Polyketide cyclase / dehydrase and lipid transport